ncbi:MAG: response regulator [Bacteroidales bacterium]|nr:response regulator [Bacteroidales bacterium]
MKQKEDISFIQNLSISYECALAIGNSLDLKEMLYEVIHKIVHKTNAQRGSIWYYKNTDEKDITLGARAGSKLTETEIVKRVDHYSDIFKEICINQKPVIKNRNEDDFYKYCMRTTGKEHSVLIIPVYKVAIIHLVYSSTVIVYKALANMLFGLSHKLNVAIDACLAHENKIKEIQIRKHTEDILKKKTNQLISHQNKLQELYAESEQNERSLLSILEDVVEKEQALKAAKEKAEESDRLKSAFLANMSHEIRTPMNAILGFSQLLNDVESEEERNKFVNLITSNSEHLLSLINDIIDVSKIEAGLMTIEKNKCSVNQLLEEIYHVFNTNKNKKIKEKNIQIKLNIPLAENESIILTDSTRLRQILSNLIDNAIKFTESGTIEYGYKIKDPQTLEFYVKDSGEGIPEDKQEIIFERFIQTDMSLTRTQGGTGLGLSITKAFVKLLGGEIRVKSKIDQGSTFYFTLPYKKAKPIIKPRASEKKATDYIWENKTILIAEDVEDNFLLIESILSNTQVQILWAKDGKEAIDICKENKNIDLILMDIRMPVINGYEATKQIKQFNNDLPIIALTAYAIDGDSARAFEYGCDDYITKPVIKEELLSLINDYL